MRADAEGFLRPSVDASRCVDCGLCAKACPSLNRFDVREPMAVFAARTKDQALRSASSSGGVFSLLARQVLAAGGVVFGAAFDPETCGVRHIAAEDEAGLAKLRGSKYVQSDLRGVFAMVRAHLKTGRKVLFSGTPCQVAGLRHFLGCNYANLLTVDMICHAVPSPLAWRKYLDERIAAEGKSGVRLVNASFRDKALGWYQFSVLLSFADGSESRRDILHDLFLQGFLTELYNRPSCHDCQCRELRSGADITIADYWMVHLKFPGIDDDRGTSLVMVNTERGKAAWDGIASGMETWVSDFEDVKKTNPAVLRSHPVAPNRARFFAEVDAQGFSKAVAALKPPVEPPPQWLALMGRGKVES